MLEAVSAEDREFAIVTFDRDGDVMLRLKREEQSLDARPEVHDTGSFTNVVIGGFKGIHTECSMRARQAANNSIAALSSSETTVHLVMVLLRASIEL
jgi:hypothetical protein